MTPTEERDHLVWLLGVIQGRVQQLKQNEDDQGDLESLDDIESLEEANDCLAQAIAALRDFRDWDV